MARKNLKDVQPIELIVEHDKPMASSLQVAKHFGKAHDNVLRDIRQLLNDIPKEWSSINFEDTNISNDLGYAIRQDPIYLMTRDGFTMLAMSFTGKKAAQWKIKYIEAFNAMEAGLRQKKFPDNFTPPEENEDQKDKRRQIVIEGLLGFWAMQEGIKFESAKNALLAHLNIKKLDECCGANLFFSAWNFIHRAFIGSQYSEQNFNEEDAENLLKLVTACRQLRYTKDANIDQHIANWYGTTFENMLMAGLNEKPALIWGLFQYFFGYTAGCIISKGQ